MDEIALGIDAISESIVAGYTVIGFAGTSFEGTPVAGPLGGGAGWISGETNPIVQQLINAGNLVASSSSALSILSDMKQGNTRAFGEISLNSQGLTIDYNQSISSSTYVSFATSAIGWAARVVEISILFQSVAVANDRGILPSTNIQSHFNLKFP